MVIRDIQTFILRVPLGTDRFFSSQCAFPERKSLLVRITTDDGLCGWGEGGQYGPAQPVAACIHHVFAPQLIGQNPCQPVRLWEEMYANTRDFGQKGAYIEAISAIDIALWDIMGQALGAPIWQLLGGAFRTSIPAYATGCYYRPEDMEDYRPSLVSLAREARGYVDAGFKMLKIKVGLLSTDADTARLAAIRDAVGPETAILVDCNHAYNAATAIRMGRSLAAKNVLWLEEPVPPEDHDGYRRVRAALDIPIAGGECEYTRYGFRSLVAGGCVDIAQPDLCVAGGFSEFQKILALASAYGVSVVPHVWGSGVAVAAALHALAATPLSPHTANPVPLQNEPVVEFDRKPNPLRDHLVGNPFVLTDGRVQVPQLPGLGVTVDDSILRKYATHD